MNLSVCAICGALECACAEQEIADRVREEKHDDGIGKDAGAFDKDDSAECGARRAKPKARAAVSENQERGK